MNFNWMDLIILAVFLFYAVEGLGVGFVRGVFDFLGFILSFALSLKFYTLTGHLLVQNFSLPGGIANALGFFLTAILLEVIFSLLAPLLLKKIPTEFLDDKVNKLLGILPGLTSAAVLLAFFLTLILTLPLSPFLKNAVSNSRIATFLTSQTAGLERFVNQVFGQAASETINFITVKPGEREIVDLRFQAKNLTADPISEQKMFELVNKERKAKGLAALVFDNRLRDVARAHAKDMLNRGYFSHYTPEGLSPFDRMVQADISFNVAAENLAFAPNMTLAHDGLIKSTGHRKNILNGEFRKVGIGVIDAGIYGKMFVQEFTD